MIKTKRLELHTLTPVGSSTPLDTVRTYQYLIRREWIGQAGNDPKAIALNACVQVPPFMVNLDHVTYSGAFAVLTITIDLDAKPRP